MCHEGPGSISPDLYWLRRDGSWLHLPMEATAEVIRFTPPEELVAALDRVTGN